MPNAPTLAIALDTTLGWRSVHQNWRDLYPYDDVRLTPSWIDIDETVPGFRRRYKNKMMRRLLGRLNMSFAVNRQMRHLKPDVALVGNMALNLVVGRNRIPIFTIMDATQKQLQAFGAGYGIYPSKYEELEKLKHRMRCRAYVGCAGIFSFSDWAKRSLIADYGVDSERVHVIPHGAVIERWRREARKETGDKPCNILFVGGDFKRKGGGLLLDWAARTKDRNWHLHVVTKDRIDPADDRITIHNGISAEDRRLTELFAVADIFALPSIVDCSPLAIAEALASGLPVVASDVGAIPELIIQGVTGFAIPLDQAETWDESLSLLINDPASRSRMGAAARQDAQIRFDAKKNIRAMVDVIASIV